MTLEQTGLLRFSVGRVGLDGEPPLYAPDGVSWEGDRIDLKGSIGAFGQPGSAYADWTLADAKALRDQLRGLGTSLAPQPFVVPDDPTLGCWVHVDGCDVTLVDLFAGEFDWSMTLYRVAARSQIESLLLHGLRDGSDVTAGNGQPLVGVPPSTLSYRRGSAAIGDLVGRAISDDAGGGEVLVGTWADDDPVEPAYWACRPGGAMDGAARLRVGPPLVPVNLLPQADAWWDVRAGLDDDGNLVDLSGNGNDLVAGAHNHPRDIFGPDDGLPSPRYFAVKTDEAESDVGSALTTPSSAALQVNGDLDLRTHAAASGDPTNGAGITQSVHVRKAETGDYRFFDYQLCLTTSADDEPGSIRLSWTDSSNVSLSVDIPADLDIFEPVEYRATLDVDNGNSEHVVTAYVRDETGTVGTFVTTADGKRWRQVGSETVAGTTDIRSGTGDLTFMIGKGWGYALQVYDGIDGTLVADLDVARDAEALDTGFDSAATGETWTVNGFSAVLAADIDGIAFTNNTIFSAATAPELDIGTGDASAMLRFRPVFVGSPGSLYLSKYQDTFGVDATGYAIGESSGLGGAGGVLSDGGTLQHALDTYTAGRHTLGFTLDRSTDDLVSYLDGTEHATDTDVSSTPDLSNTGALTVRDVTAGMIFYGAAIWQDRVLTATEAAQVDAELASAALPEANPVDVQLAAMRTVVGDRLPGDIDPDAGWVLDNGLVRAYPALGVHPSSGERGGITVECWGGAAWESPTDWFFASTGGIIDGFATMEVLANEPHEVRVRLTSTNFTGDLFESLFLTLRRGDRMVAGVVTATESTNIVVQAPAVASTSALTGGERADSADGDGNRAVVATGAGAASGGPLGVVLNATALDFGVGHEIDGSGSSSPDTAQDLADQYAAWVSETIALRGTPA